MTKAVLFDLDGTFADTAPDLCLAINRMRVKRNLPEIPVSATRPVTSLGARGLLGVGFGMKPDDDGYIAMRDEFLDYYNNELCVHTVLFPGMESLITALEKRTVRWGIVTNKAERFAKPLISQLGLDARCGCVIGGDTTARTKPHPEPLLAACRVINIDPQFCIYVGDDERDIIAGRAAGMRTVAVGYGYLNGGRPEAWGADVVVQTPMDILDHL